MTDYGFTRSRQTTLPSNTVQEKKQARKKLLDAVFQRRRENYIRWHKKMQLQKQSDLDKIA